MEVLTQQTLGGLQVRSVSEQPQTFNLLVYGDSGVGKTVLAGSASMVEEMCPVLLLDVEGGTMSLKNTYPDVDVVRIESWRDMQSVYDPLYDRELPYRTVILDSLTEMQKLSMNTIMRELLNNDPSRDPDVPGMREWGKSTEQIRRLVRGFRDLPTNTIVTALAKQDKDQRTGLTKIQPSLPGKLAAEIPGFLDIVAYYYIKVRNDDIKRLLLTQPTETQVAKDRTGQLPMVVEEPTMRIFADCIFTSNKETNTNA